MVNTGAMETVSGLMASASQQLQQCHQQFLIQVRVNMQIYEKFAK